MDTPENLTEDYIAEHTDIYLGTVVLRASQVRALIRQNTAARKILHDARLILRALEANGDNDAAHLAKEINQLLGDAS